MREYLKFYIDGQWIEPLRPNALEVDNPTTEEVSGRIALGSSADVDLAVNAARLRSPLPRPLLVAACGDRSFRRFILERHDDRQIILVLVFALASCPEQVVVRPPGLDRLGIVGFDRRQ